MKYQYYFAWKNNEKRITLYRKHCRVLGRGKMNSALVEFEGGQREIISRNALRKREKMDNQIKITHTYHVKGTLKRTFPASTIHSVRHSQYQVNQEIEATSIPAAVDAFEVHGWKWIKPPDVWLITEAKMERAGQPSLFPLEEIEEER